MTNYPLSHEKNSPLPTKRVVSSLNGTVLFWPRGPETPCTFLRNELIVKLNKFENRGDYWRKCLTSGSFFRNPCALYKEYNQFIGYGALNILSRFFIPNNISFIQNWVQHFVTQLKFRSGLKSNSCPSHVLRSWLEYLK